MCEFKVTDTTLLRPPKYWVHFSIFDFIFIIQSKKNIKFYYDRLQNNENLATTYIY